MDFNKLKECAAKYDIKEVEIYKVVKNGISIETFNDEIDSTVVSNTDVMAIRGVYNNQIATVYVENDSDEIIEDVVKIIKENASLVNKDEPYFIFEGSKEYPTLPNFTYDFDDYTLDDKINLCFDLAKKIKAASPLVDKTEVNYSESSYEYQIINSNGLNVKKVGRGVTVYGGATCQKDGEAKSGYDYQIVKNIKEIDLEKITKGAVERTVAKFGAGPVESGKYPVVFENKVFANLLGAFSSIYSAENVLKNLSLLKDKIGEKVFGDNITLIDDPLNLEANNQDTFDDEGVATFKKNVIEKGVLKTYLHNLKTAKMMNTTSTANASKAGVSANVGVSTSNFYLESGSESFDEIISNIEYGILITELMGLHAGVNAISGDFSLQSSGFEIENGKITKPVTLIIVSGNIVKVLNDVEKIANDFKFNSGFGSSSVLIKELSVSGK